MIIAGVRFIDMGLKAWVFTEADKTDWRFEAAPRVITEDGKPVPEELTDEEKEARQAEQIRSQRQRDAANSLAMLIVGAPLYVYHWRLAGKRKDEE